jgi:signal transduction histidine kinase
MSSPARILVVDDNEAVRAATRRALEAAGYETFEAPDGEEAVRIAGRQQPDLILMDVTMPRLGGLEALQRIKADLKLSTAYVIIVSGSRVDTDSQVRGLETGADGYLVRPISNRELVARVQSMLRIKAAEDAVRQKEAQLRALVASNFDGMLVVDRQGKALFANPAACELLNRSQQMIEGQTMDLPLMPGELTELDLQGRDGQRRIVELRVAELDWQGQPAFLAALRDITRRKQAEDEIRVLNAQLEQRVEARTRELREVQEKLLRHERLAVLGQLAGSVAHELRSPLAVIANAAYFLKLVLPGADSKVKDYLNLIEREIHNADKIVTDLLGFSSARRAEREAIHIEDLAARALERFPPPAAVTVTVDFPPTLTPVYVDPRQVEQVLGNLVVNACQAMPDGGHLTLSAAAQADQILVAVADTGTGILPENLGRLFEPLFTTKSQGIGLGLAVCQRLVEVNAGRIEAHSSGVPGQGATFRIYLPCSPESECQTEGGAHGVQHPGR